MGISGAINLMNSSRLSPVDSSKKTLQYIKTVVLSSYTNKLPTSLSALMYTVKTITIPNMVSISSV